MRAAIWLVLLAIVAVALALSAQSFSGYVSIFIERERIDVSLALASLLLLAAFVLFYSFVQIALWTIRLPDRVRRYRVRRSAERARTHLEDALEYWFEGRYARAQRAASAIPGESDLAAYGHLIAAQNAIAMQEYERAIQHIQAAQASAQTHEQTQLRTAIAIAQAQCQLGQRQPEQAVQTLRQLHAAGARVTLTLKLLMQAEYESGHLEQAASIAKRLFKRNAIDAYTAQRMGYVPKGVGSGVGNTGSAGSNAQPTQPTQHPQRAAGLSLVQSKADSSN